MAAREFQAAREGLVAELSSAKKVAAKTRQSSFRGDGRKNRKSDPIRAEWELQGVELQDFRFGAGIEG